MGISMLEDEVLHSREGGFMKSWNLRFNGILHTCYIPDVHPLEPKGLYLGSYIPTTYPISTL